MKYSELPVKTLDEIRNDKTFIICSNVNTDEENKINSIDKCLVNATGLASKDEVLALTEQNAKLVKIISQLTSKTQEIEKTIYDIKDSLSKKESEQDMNAILEQLSLLEERLENNIVEL